MLFLDSIKNKFSIALVTMDLLVVCCCRVSYDLHTRNERGRHNEFTICSNSRFTCISSNLIHSVHHHLFEPNIVINRLYETCMT